MALDADRRAHLERARAEALLRRVFSLDIETVDLQTAPFGVTARVDDRAWVVSMSDDLAVLGGVLVWLDRNRSTELDLVVDHHAGIHARRAAVLAPECRVWETDDADVRRAEPSAVPPALPRPTDAAHLESVLVEAGIDVVCEDGILRGELAGLEVARILHGPDGPVLEAGVGRFDREAAVLFNAGVEPARAVANAAVQVRPHRVEGAVSHAINRLARERWLRSVVIDDPTVIDIDLPELVEPIPPRVSLLEAVPAAVLGIDGAQRVLAVCSVGVDLGLVPAIADLVAVHDPDLVRIVVPERDKLPLLERLARRLPLPVEVRSVDVPWMD